MANAIYWDTSALIKLYAPEPDSSDYLRLLIQQPENLAISFLTSRSELETSGISWLMSTALIDAKDATISSAVPFSTL